MTVGESSSCISVAYRTKAVGEFDGAAWGDDAPALAVNLYAGQPLRRFYQDAFDLMRFERWIRFEHAGDD